MVVDKDIQTYLDNAVDDKSEKTAIEYGKKENVTIIGYDLTAEGFIDGTKLVETYELAPGESIFVQSAERIHFGVSTIGKVFLKNSRIRMGLSLDAPVYQPGHRTKIFCRLTNLSKDNIKLEKGEKYAMLTFEELPKQPHEKYDGTFQDENQFRGLAEYDSTYAKQMEKVQGKVDELKKLEKSIYSNVATLLTIFIAIFTILNVNIEFAANLKEISPWMFLAFNLVILGGISFLCVLMHTLQAEQKGKHLLFWLIPILCFAGIFFIIA